jgi:hypothetical protein
MLCEMCNNESNVIYATSANGFICSKCMSKVKDSDDEKIRQYQEKLVMYKKYGLTVDKLEEMIECLKEKNGCRPK